MHPKNELTLEQKLDLIIQQQQEQALLQKKVFNLSEAAKYMSRSESHLYKLTSKKLIEFSQPTGKLIYFEREKLDEFLLRNKVKTSENLNNEAATILTLKKKRV